jgi:hypothetical protein
MIGYGIAPNDRFNDDQVMPSRPFVLSVQEQGSAAFDLHVAAVTVTQAQAALDELRRRLDAFGAAPDGLRRLDARQLEQLAGLGEEVAELASRIALIFDGIPLEGMAVTEREIAGAARAALADGIADERRALTAARLLTAAEGFPALAAALLDSDAPGYWTARVVDVLAAFRGVDGVRARQVAALAGVPETARFCELRPERVVELAHVVRQLAAR